MTLPSFVSVYVLWYCYCNTYLGISGDCVLQKQVVFSLLINDWVV